MLTSSHLLKQISETNVFDAPKRLMTKTNTHIMKKTLGYWGVLALFFMLLSTHQVHAQQDIAQIQDLTLTLSEAIEVAVANNPDVKRGILATDDAKELVKIAYSEIYPNISSSINYTRNIELPVNFLPGEIFGGEAGTLIPVAFGTDNNWQGGFSVSQTLFRGETIIGLSTSTIYEAVQKENLRLVSQQVVTQTRLAYYQVLVAEEQLRLQEAQIQRIEKNLTETEKRAEAGIVDDYDVLQLRVQLSNQKPQKIEAEYAVAEAYRNLKLVMGIPYQFKFEVVGKLNEFDIVAESSSSEVNSDIKRIDQLNAYSYEESVIPEATDVSARGDLNVLEASMELKDKEITAVKSRFLPTISANYNLQWTAVEAGSPNFFEDAVRFQTVGVNLSLPLFQGFKRVADVQRVLIEKKDLEEQVRAATLNGQNEIASASEDLNMAFETASARKIALEQAQEGYERAQKRYNNGLGSQLEVLEAEVQVRQAEVNYALMVFNYLAAKAQYDLATGSVPLVDNPITNRF